MLAFSFKHKNDSEETDSSSQLHSQNKSWVSSMIYLNFYASNFEALYTLAITTTTAFDSLDKVDF